MKCRNGFVSNSSSCSFIAVTVLVPDSELINKMPLKDPVQNIISVWDYWVLIEDSFPELTCARADRDITKILAILVKSNTYDNFDSTQSHTLEEIKEKASRLKELMNFYKLEPCSDIRFEIGDAML